MADCFISYRRTPSAPVATTLQAKLESKYGFDVYVDTTRTDGTRIKFPERLMGAIADAPVFVCLLGERDGQHTLQSEWVLKEIQQAYDLGKFCIPVFQESYRPLPDMPPAVDYLLGFDGVHYFDQKNVMVDDSVRQIADLIRPHRKRRRNIPLLISLGIVIGVFVLGIGLFLARENPGDATPTSTSTATTATTPPPFATTEIAQAVTDSPTDALTLSSFQVLQTTEADDAAATQTQAALNLTAAQAQTLAVIAAETAAQIHATKTAARGTLIARSWTPTFTPSLTFTPTPTPTFTPTHSPIPVGFPGNPVTSNAAWEAHITESEFNGFAMMLVPVGCFMMGDDISRFEDEKPAYEVCFDVPFWIDKYEVTNAQYASTGCTDWSSEPQQPRNCVTWFEARDFCAGRDARLPTEAEWEYVARGPDGLVYPWGNTYIIQPM